MTQKRNKWDRIPDTKDRKGKTIHGESEPAYEAFMCALEMGSDRSTAKVGQKLGKSKTLMDRWSSQWHWTERLAAWDAHLYQDRLSKIKLRQVEELEFQAKLGRAGQLKSAEGLRNLDATTLKAQEITSLAKIFGDMAARANELPTEIMEARADNPLADYAQRYREKKRKEAEDQAQARLSDTNGKVSHNGSESLVSIERTDNGNVNE